MRDKLRDFLISKGYLARVPLLDEPILSLVQRKIRVASCYDVYTGGYGRGTITALYDERTGFTYSVSTRSRGIMSGEYADRGYNLESNQYLVIPDSLKDVPTNGTCCDEKFQISEFAFNQNDIMCPTCVEEYSNVCYSCRSSFKKDQVKTIEDRIFCKKCVENIRYKKCYHCKVKKTADYTLWNSITIGSLYKAVCRPCINEHFVRCSCSRYMLRGEENNECDRCGSPSCGSSCDHNCSYQIFRNGSFKKIEGTKQGKFIKSERLTGVELEIVDKYLEKISSYRDNGERREKTRLETMGKLPKYVKVTRDGSVSNNHCDGLEIVTPPRSLDKLEEMVGDSCGVLRKGGFGVNKTCGVHVHLDASDIKENPKKLAQLLRAYYSVEDILYSVNPPSRWNNDYCIPISKRYVFNDFRANMKLDDFECMWYGVKENFSLRITKDKNYIKSLKKNHYTNTKYSALNLHSTNYRGTVEFRHHAGTLNTDKLLGWISILHSIVDYVKKYKDKDIIELYNMDTGYSKIERFCEIFDVTEIQRDYVYERATKFNKKFAVFKESTKDRSEKIKTLNQKSLQKIKDRDKKDSDSRLSQRIRSYQEMASMTFSSSYGGGGGG